MNAVSLFQVPRTRELANFILEEIPFGLLQSGSPMQFYSREGEGFKDLCFWWGGQDIINDPMAKSHRILWVYIGSEPGTTVAYQMWDDPETGEQMELERQVRDDYDIQSLVFWLSHAD